MPAFPGWRAALGPGIVWMARAQGSGELIWWPYLMAKYGLGLLFLLIPAHLIWLSTVDALSRVHAEMLQEHFPSTRRRPFRVWYYVFLIALTVVTGLTMPLAQPGQLILLTALIAFVGTVAFSSAIVILNHVVLPRRLPPFARPGPLSLLAMVLSAGSYLGLMIAYVAMKLWG